MRVLVAAIIWGAVAWYGVRVVVLMAEWLDEVIREHRASCERCYQRAERRHRRHQSSRAVQAAPSQRVPRPCEASPQAFGPAPTPADAACCRDDAASAGPTPVGVSAQGVPPSTGAMAAAGREPVAAIWDQPGDVRLVLLQGSGAHRKGVGL